MKRYKEVNRAHREIDPAYLRRAAQVPDQLLGPYLDSVVDSLHQALDAWRFRNAPADDLQLAVDALNALIAEAEARGLA